MKSILIAIISLFMLASCQKEQKKETSKQNKQVSPKVQKTISETNTSQNSSTENTNVIVDAVGVAIISMTTNDVMKFNINSMTVKAGQKVKLTLTHTGKLDKRVMGHNVVILQKGVKMPSFAQKAAASKDNDYIPAGTTDVVAHTKMIGGGETTTIAFTAPEVGVYNFICSFPGHYAIMRGKFIVE